MCELHAESTFKIEGMDCREEVAMLERRFKNLTGLEDFSADLMGQRLHVNYDAAKLTTSTIADAVADAGMRAWLEHEEPVVLDDSAERRRRADAGRVRRAACRRPGRCVVRRAVVGVARAVRGRDRRGRRANRAQGLERPSPRTRSTSTC